MPCEAGPSREQVRAEARIPVLLCSACRALERLGYDFDENPELSLWWAPHKARDEERERTRKQERQRQAWLDAQMERLSTKPVGELTDAELRVVREAMGE